MSESPLSSEQAEADLARVAAARVAVVTATRRPAWLDAIIAVGIGGLAGLFTTRTAWGMGAGAALFVLGVAAVLWLGRPYVRRRGRVVDGRAIGTQSVVNAITIGLFSAATALAPRPGEAWYSIVTGLGLTLVTFVLIRWEDGYQARRLAAGDYHRYDLL